MSARYSDASPFQTTAEMLIDFLQPSLILGGKAVEGGGVGCVLVYNRPISHL